MKLKKEMITILQMVDSALNQSDLQKTEIEEILAMMLTAYKAGFAEGVATSAETAAEVLEGMRRNCAIVCMALEGVPEEVDQALHTLDEIEERLGTGLNDIPIMPHELD